MPDDSQEKPDGVLVAAAQAGDRASFETLVRRYEQPLLRVAYGRLELKAWAEDAVQETFLCAYRWLPSYDSRYSFRTWLWTILLNQCHRLAQRARRVPRVDCHANLPPSEVEQCRPAPDHGTTPLAGLLRAERTEILERMLRRLPEPQGDTLRLRFYGGLSFPEIAVAMNCAVSTAKVRLRAGLLQLSIWLSGDGDSAIAELELDHETHD